MGLCSLALLAGQLHQPGGCSAFPGHRSQAQKLPGAEAGPESVQRQAEQPSAPVSALGGCQFPRAGDGARRVCDIPAQ